MHVERRKMGDLVPCRSYDVYTTEGQFNVQYHVRGRDEYVSVQGETVAKGKRKLSFSIGSLPATLTVRVLPLFRQRWQSLAIGDQVVLAEKWYEPLLNIDRNLLMALGYYLVVFGVISLIVSIFSRVAGLVVFIYLGVSGTASILSGMNKISKDSLLSRVDPSKEMGGDATDGHQQMRGDIRFTVPALHADEWRDFASKMVEGDEIWRWSTPKWTWKMLMGREGYVIVHDGEPTRHILTTGMN
jgi:hypothetical protein